MVKRGTKQWEVVEGTQGRYWVSNTGDILSRRRNLVLAPRTTLNGYKQVALSTDKGIWYARVHRLVLLGFRGAPARPDMVAAHLNGDKTDNRLENLQWMSPRDNQLRTKHERTDTTKLTANDVLWILARYAEGRPKMWIARQKGVHPRTIDGIVAGRVHSDVVAYLRGQPSPFRFSVVDNKLTMVG